jgi:hypothetical protein
MRVHVCVCVCVCVCMCVCVCVCVVYIHARARDEVVVGTAARRITFKLSVSSRHITLRAISLLTSALIGSPSVRQVLLADPDGSVFTTYFRTGELGGGRPFLVEGVGKSDIPGCLNLSVVDDVIPVTDSDAFDMCYKLAQKEGIFVGGSAGLNVHAACQLASTLEGPATVVTLLCDLGVKCVTPRCVDCADPPLCCCDYAQCNAMLLTTHPLPHRHHRPIYFPSASAPSLVCSIDTRRASHAHSFPPSLIHSLPPSSLIHSLFHSFILAFNSFTPPPLPPPVHVPTN